MVDNSSPIQAICNTEISNKGDSAWGGVYKDQNTRFAFLGSLTHLNPSHRLTTTVAPLINESTTMRLM